MLIVFLVEIVNLTVLLANDNIKDVLMNFMALVVIAEFDDIFFIGVKNQEKLAQLIIKGEIKFPRVDAEGELDEERLLNLEELTKIETTTSIRAENLIEVNKIRREGNRLEAANQALPPPTINENNAAEQAPTVKYEGEPDYIYIDFGKQTWQNKVLRSIYQILKHIHVGIWFYFIPFSSLFLSYWIPYYLDAKVEDNLDESIMNQNAVDGDMQQLNL